MLVRIADHLGHAGKGGDFLRSALRIAAGDHDLRVGILPMNAADGGACVLIGRGRYRAGVEDDESSLSRTPSARSRPRSRSWRSMAAPSAWVARQPKFAT